MGSINRVLIGDLSKSHIVDLSKDPYWGPVHMGSLCRPILSILLGSW